MWEKHIMWCDLGAEGGLCSTVSKKLKPLVLNHQKLISASNLKKLDPSPVETLIRQQSLLRICLHPGETLNRGPS